MDIHVYFHNDQREVLSRLAAIQRQLSALQIQEDQIMATSVELLQAATDETTIIDSVVAAIDALRAEVKAIPGMSAQDQSNIDAAFSKITGNKTTLSAALTANTTVPVVTVNPVP